MEHFYKSFLTTSFYRLLKNITTKFGVVNGSRIFYAPSVYLLILGSLVFVCEIIVLRHDVQGFYLEVLKEMNTIFYIKKSTFGFELYERIIDHINSMK